MEKDTACKHQSNKAKMAILTSERIDYGAKKITRDRKDYITIK